MCARKLLVTLITVLGFASAAALPPAAGASGGGLVYGSSFSDSELKQEENSVFVRSLAVSDATGDILAGTAAPVGNVDVFSASGGHLATWTGADTPAKSFTNLIPVGVAVDNSTSPLDPNAGEVYVAGLYGVFALRIGSGGVEEAGSFTAKEPYVEGNEITGTPNGPFSALVGGIAVNTSTGDIYVADAGASQVYVFHASGEYAGELTGASIEVIRGLGVNSATGTVYVGDARSGVVDVFNSKLEYESALEGFGGGFFVPGYVAVDTKEDLTYVAGEVAHQVDVFNGAGELAAQLAGTPFEAFATGTDEGGPHAIALNEATGAMYVFNNTIDTIDVFLPGPPLPIPVTTATTRIEGGEAQLNGELNPDGVELFYYFTYNVGKSCSGGSASSFTPTGTSLSTEKFSLIVRGIKPMTEYTDCINVGPEESEPLSAVTFTTGRLAPAVRESVPAANNIRGDEATLEGTVNPEEEATTYYFNYGPTTAYGLTSSSPPGVVVGSGSGGVHVAARVTGLEGRSVYDFQLVAVNKTGESKSQNATLETLSSAPLVSVGQPTSLTPFTATLAGTVNPNNAGVPAEDDTAYCLEYGTTTEYRLGYLPTGSSQEVGEGDSAVPISIALQGLAPATTYHYRLAAVNLGHAGFSTSACGGMEGQASFTADQTFTTPSPLAPVASTGATSDVTQNAATVSGTVDPEGRQAFYEFDLGTDTTYGSRVFGEVGLQTGPRDVSVTFQSLAPGTLYHYRLVASGPGGTTYGADQTFMTPTFPTAVLSAPAVEPLLATPAVVFPIETRETEMVKATAPKAKKKKKKGKGKGKGKAKRKPRKRAEQAGRVTVAGRGALMGRSK